jgi:hypothetical protein
MSPADWNWADFNGATLSLIAHRHSSKIPPALLDKVRTGLRHAAYSIERRNVAMSYTNIAIQGTFVTLAAGQLLDDAHMKSYASERLRRFAHELDKSGSFAEYNSPTYVNVSLVNLTRMRMVLRDPGVLALADRIHTRAWMHLAKHWHVPSRQLAGPMSRCYSTDIGAPLWLQKSLGGRLVFATREEIAARRIDNASEAAMHDYRCPDPIAPMFLEAPRAARLHREVFIAAEPPVRPVQGTTWLDRDFCLGSANRSDFWIQRRPLLAYWGGPERPARFVQMRFLKDDYDFSSALLYSVQERNFVLGLVNFRSPGGDRHISLDPIQTGEFAASRLRLCIDIAGAPESARVLPDESRVAVDLGGAKLWFQVREAAFGKDKPKLTVGRERDRLVVSLDLIPRGPARTIRYADLGQAFVAFTLAMEGRGGSIDAFDKLCRGAGYSADVAAGKFSWRSPAGGLELTGGTTVRTVSEHDRAFTEQVDGKPVPLVLLSHDKLAPGA